VFNVVNAAKLTKDVLADFVDYMKTDWRSGMAWAFDSFLSIMKTTFTSAVTLAIAAGKGIGKAFKDHILGGKSADINKKMSDILGTPGNARKYIGAISVNESLVDPENRRAWEPINRQVKKDLVWNKDSTDYKALRAEAEKQYISEQTKNIIGKSFETIADDFKKTFKEIAESAPTALSDAAKKRRAEFEERARKFYAGEGAPVTIGRKRRKGPDDEEPPLAAKGGGGRKGLAPVQTSTMTIEPGFIFGPQKQTAENTRGILAESKKQTALLSPRPGINTPTATVSAQVLTDENTRGILIESQKQTAILSRNPGDTSGPDSTGTKTIFVKYANQAVASLSEIVNILRDSSRTLDNINRSLTPTGGF